MLGLFKYALFCIRQAISKHSRLDVHATMPVASTPGEAGRFQMGYLSYALTKKGLEEEKSDGSRRTDISGSASGWHTE